ncbi:hypothetical protein F4778DRAFT_779325 [Xylariomycetidae sp. FL2044]|nr:hypothetical protein F4778DRAFT_779325 [Xylariomycetidae sp. FL2044]
MRFVGDDRVVDPKTQKSIQVIAAGLPRCATSSIQAALESQWLGFSPSMHMAHTMPWPERSQMVIDALRETDKHKRQSILYKLFQGHAATCDFPGVAFTSDLMDMYPDAKIVLNQRKSADVWATSLEDSLMFFHSWTYRICTFLIKTDRLHVRMQLESFDLFNRHHGYQYSEWSRATHIAWYQRYNAWVLSEARKRNREVLLWQPSDGWDTLCKFLDRPVPPASVPFPHANDKHEIARLKVVLCARGLAAWGLLGLAVWVGLAYGRLAWAPCFYLMWVFFK